MKNWTVKLCLIFTLIFVSNQILAQEVSAKLDTTHYLIGDWIPLELQANVSEKDVVSWPIIDATIDEIEVLNRSSIDSNITAESKTYSQILTLTVFDSGYFPIPAFEFIVNGDTLLTEPQVIIISSIALDTASNEVKPIKDTLAVPLTFMDIFWPYGAIGLLALLLLGLALYLLSRKKPKMSIKEIVEIIVPAHEWAFDELSQLKAQALWQNDQTKKYYSKISEILRGYIERRYNKPALESTTDEVVNQLKLLRIDHSLLEQIQSTLTLSDYVKFAKAKPLESDHHEVFEAIYTFVDQTKLIVTKQEEDKV